MNMIFRRKLPIPKDIKEMYPLTEVTAAIKAQRDAQIKDIFAGKSAISTCTCAPVSGPHSRPHSSAAPANFINHHPPFRQNKPCHFSAARQCGKGSQEKIPIFTSAIYNFA
jgi:hypothetical protein